jgi:AraC family transcriptional regulator, transcriptional activator of pobA
MKKIPIRQIRSSIKEQASSGRFSIRKVEDLLNGKDLMQDLHRHDFFFILALQKGAGKHEIDFIPYEVLDHVVFMIRPGQVHQLHLKANSAGYIMEFNKAFYQPTDKASNQRLGKAGNKNFCQLNKERFEKLQAILTYIFQEYRDKQEAHQDIIKANLDIFFIELVRQSQTSDSISKNITPYIQDRMEEFLELLDKHIISRKQVSQYSDLMNLSIYQLNEITKTSIGKTPSELINEHIILEAKRQLLATPNQIKDIAGHLGYEDPSYFIRFFKKQTGLSPEVFRQKFG